MRRKYRTSLIKKKTRRSAAYFLSIARQKCMLFFFKRAHHCTNVHINDNTCRMLSSFFSVKIILVAVAGGNLTRTHVDARKLGNFLLGQYTK